MGKTISVEVDILNDFINEDGALSVPGAHKLRSNFKKLAQLVDDAELIRVAVRDAHFHDNDELEKNGGDWPDHAMVTTDGAEVIEEMNFKDWALCIEHQTGLGMFNRDRDHVEWMIEESVEYDSRYYSLEKQDYPMFSNPFAVAMLEIMDTDNAIVSGVATEICVRSAVLDMQDYGIQCYVVKDAIAGIDEANIEQAMQEMADAGAIFITLDCVEDMLK